MVSGPPLAQGFGVTSISQPASDLIQRQTRHPRAALGQRLRIDMDGYRICLFLLTVLTVSRVHQAYSFLAALRPGLVLFVIAAGSALLNRRRLATASVLQTWPGKVTVAFLVMACLSTPFGISLGGSASFILSDYSKTIVYALLVTLALGSAKDLYAFAWAYVIGTGVTIWMTFFLFKLSNTGSKAERLGTMFAYDANDVGVVILIGLALTLLTFQSSGKVGKTVSGIILVGIGVTIARTGSRGALLGLIAVGVTLLFMLKSVSIGKRIGFVLVTGLALVLFAPPGYWDQMRTMMNPKDDYNWSSQDGRKQVALRGLDYMLGHPLSGLGINNFSRAECLDPNSQKVQNHVTGTGLRCTAPHNSYVQAGAELGIPGLMLWVGLILGGIFGMSSLRRRLPASWRRGSHEERFLYNAPLYLCVGMVGFAVSSAFVSFAWVDPVYFLLALMSGVYWITRQRIAAGQVEGFTPGPAAPPGPRGRPVFRPHRSG